MAQSDARFGYKANLSREDHDLSRQFGFTCCPGMLCPIFADVATPGDAYYINHDLTFLRTAPLAAPAMVDVKVHYESFFVPIQMIYQPAENSFFSLKTIQSSLYSLNSLSNERFPLVDYSGFITSWRNSTAVSLKTDAFRLIDFLGLNPLALLPTSTWDYAPNFFPWQLLAYNTIFQYYYRLDDKSQMNNQNCNWDQNYSYGGVPITVTLGGSSLFTLYNRPWAFDYFTSMYRSPIVSLENMQAILPQGDYSDLSTLSIQGINLSGSNAGQNPDIVSFSANAPGTFATVSAKQAASTAIIRQVFANEKLAMITGRTRKNYDSQVLAHYGVHVPHDVKHDLTLIGHDEFTLKIGEVTSLASTSDAPLGELAGKGWSSGQGKRHKFVAPCHGVVMTLFSIEPLQRYEVGFERHNAVVDSFDLPTPEFDRLGNVPMFRYEVNYKTGTQSWSDIIGWKERYYQFKRRSNRVNVAFMGVPGPNISGFVNDYSAYMIVNRPFNAAPASEGSYYIPFNAMDDVMLQHLSYNWHVPQSETDKENWNIEPWLCYARDPFIVDSFEKVKKVSWMSKDGEPVYPF